MKSLLVAALLSAGLLAALPPAGAPPTGRYALLLEEPPVASQVSSRYELHSVQARQSAARIEAQQLLIRQQLATRRIPVLGSVTHLLNAVFVLASPGELPALRALPGVSAVAPLHRFKLVMNKALPLIKAQQAWTALSSAGIANPGAGVKIGIIDTGIDAAHAAFQDNSMQAPAGFPLCSIYNGTNTTIACDSNIANGKVIVARSYVPMLAAGSPPGPANSHPDDNSPRDHVGHGTAVAMAAAGVVHDTAFGSMSGVAPKAWLGSYKVFGSPGVNDYATGDAILQALDDAYSDGMDVVNLSLGWPAWYSPNDTGAACGAATGSPCDIEAQAVEKAVRRGMTVVVAAGNDGDYAVNLPALSTVDSPGTAPSAITVGGARNAHNLYAKAAMADQTAPDNLKTMPAMFGDGPQPTQPLAAEIRDVGGLGCDTLAAGSLTGAIALVQRGSCYFVDKVRNTQNAGAAGVVIYCNDTQYCADGGDKLFTPTGLSSTAIPAVLIGRSDGQALHTYLAGHAGARLTLDPALTEFVDDTVNTISSFSSRGPSIAPSTALKPELVAVAGNLYLATQSYDANSDMFSPTGYQAVDGTSFAAPMTAGVAALVKQKNPDFTPTQIKSAIVDTANSGQPVVSGEPRTGAMGAGELDAEAAVKTNVVVDPATLPFGAITLLSIGSQRTLNVTNNSGASLALSVEPYESGSAAHLRVNPATVPPHQTTAVSVFLEGSLPPAGSYGGAVVITGGAVNVRVPYQYLVASNVLDNLFPISNDTPTGSLGETLPWMCLRAVDPSGTAALNVPVQWQATGGASLATSNDPNVCGTGNTPCNLFDTQTFAYGVACAQVVLGATAGEQDVIATIGSGTSALTYTFAPTARPLPSISANGVVNAASSAASNGSLPAIAPGSYISIYGSALSDSTLVFSDRLAPNHVYLPLSLAGASVSFDVPGTSISVPGRLHYVSPGMVNVQVPWELQGRASARMKVSLRDQSSAVYTVPLADAAPGIFLYRDPGDSQLYAAAQILPSYQLIGPASPVRRGDAIIVYVNGLGPVTNQPATGEISSADPVLPETANTVSVTIGGQPAPDVYFAGLSPNYIGLYQVNVRVPENAPTGSQPVVVTVAGNSSPAANIVIR